jgi:hypothetical protein
MNDTDVIDCATCRHAHITAGVWICTHERAALPAVGIFSNCATVAPSCEIARLPGNLCGVIARLFEPRTQSV